ncbi:hypothetical protein ACGLHS_17145 [Variovorax sp. VaC1]|uniref:hypothetical protein n=1 Tax=Variovorax sp. VaC1 TaxID=3373132 RepID=UPI003748633D
MSVHTEILRKLQATQALVDLYREHLDQESLTGVVSGFNETFVYLSLFGDDGLPNGISVVHRLNITRIRWGGNERVSIQELIDAKGSKAMAPVLDLESTRSVLESVQQAFGYVNVMTEGSRSSVTFIGELAEIDDQSLVLNEFGTMQTRQGGHLWLPMDEITRVDADASYERDIKFLADKRRAS